MANVSIARRYARALIDVGAESNSLDRFGRQLSSLAQTMGNSAELTEVMVNPAYGRNERSAIIDGLSKALGGFDPEVMNFLRLLVDRNRTPLLPDIARIFGDLADARAGRVRGKVTSAVPLAPDTVKRISDIFESMTQRTVVMETKVDPSLLGGVAAQVGSTMYDGSLRTQLEELRRTMRT